MGMDWYDMIALRNGGYKSNSQYCIEGISGEDIFEDKLVGMLGEFNEVLDAGCGHGAFTIKMARYAKKIIGFDNSKELLKIAQSSLNASEVKNVEFVYAWTHQDLPFKDGQFDLIYDRRGPTSILNHSRILKSGGTIFGIHSAALDIVKQRLALNGFVNVEIEEFNDAIMHFPDDIEFAKYLASVPGNPDYTLPQYRAELQSLINENTMNGEIVVKQWRYIWKAIKP